MDIMSAMTVIRRRMTLGPLLLASFLLASCGGGGGSSGSPPPTTTPPSDLNYPTPPTFIVGTAVAPLTPTVAGEVTSYSVSPALPAGLSLNTTSGVISGTPTSVTAKASYTVKATNAGGSTTATVSIVVMAAAPVAPSDLKYPTPPTLVVSTAITPLTPTVVGEVTSYSVSPALPAGLSLNTTSGVISGTPTNVAAKASYTVKATNAGGSTTATVSIVVMAATPAYTAKSGVAQKGPLIQGSTVTAQELDASLSPTGEQFSYQILTNLGTFSPTSTFTSPYIGLIATGYYFDEVQNAVSTGTVTLNGYSDLAVDTVLNVNLLTTLTYQRIQNLITTSNMTFTTARTQAESEVLAAFYIPVGSYNSFATFSTLNLAGGTDADDILAALSSIFVYGNASGPLSQLIASFQSDMGANGVITNTATTATLAAAAQAISPGEVAGNLNQEYLSQGVTFTATDISNWIDQNGDGLIGKFKFQVLAATAASSFTVPSSIVSLLVGQSVTVSAGQLSVNGTAATGPITVNSGDVLTISPGAGGLPTADLTCYLLGGANKVARVDFFAEGNWQTVTPLPAGRDQHTATLLPNGKVLIVGGVLASGVTATALIYDPSANTWAPAASLATARSYHTATLLPNGEVMVAGGSPDQGGTVLASAEIYDPTANTWSAAASLATARMAHTATLLPNGTVLVAGGSNQTGTEALASAEIYDPAANTSSPAGNLATPRFFFTATLLSNGLVLAAGGGNSSAVIASAELYDPSANAWSSAGSLATSRTNHTATLLSNGMVMVAGGDTIQS